MLLDNPLQLGREFQARTLDHGVARRIVETASLDGAGELMDPMPRGLRRRVLLVRRGLGTWITGFAGTRAHDETPVESGLGVMVIVRIVLALEPEPRRSGFASHVAAAT